MHILSFCLFWGKKVEELKCITVYVVFTNFKPIFILFIILVTIYRVIELIVYSQF